MKVFKLYAYINPFSVNPCLNKIKIDFFQMAGVPIPLHGGRYRRAEFFVCLPAGMNLQMVLTAALDFKEQVREF